MNERLNRIIKAAAVTAVAATTTTVAMAGTAHAYTYAGSGATQYQGATTGTYCDSTCPAGPPTQNLANLSKDMFTASKSVSAGVHFHPGDISGGSTVAFSVKWGTSGATSLGNYNNSYGNNFAFNFPANDGSQRWEVVSVTMTEHTSAGQTFTYTSGRSVPIQALWDVAFSPLNFTLLNDCAWIGDSNFDLYFTQTGVQGKVSFGLGQNQTHSVGEFARTWTEASTATDLRMPSVSFWNTDFHWSGAYLEGPPALSSQTVLPAASGTRSMSWIQEDGTNNCDARLSYSITTALRTYSV